MYVIQEQKHWYTGHGSMPCPVSTLSTVEFLKDPDAPGG